MVSKIKFDTEKLKVKVSGIRVWDDGKKQFLKAVALKIEDFCDKFALDLRPSGIECAGAVPASYCDAALESCWDDGTFDLGLALIGPMVRYGKVTIRQKVWSHYGDAMYGDLWNDVVSKHHGNANYVDTYKMELVA